MNELHFTRRQLLKVAGAAVVASVPVVIGGRLVSDARGESLPRLAPYSVVPMLESWPASPAEASPLLLLVSAQSANPFGFFLTELLRTEGLNCFQTARFEDIDGAPLQWYGTIILTEGPLQPEAVQALTTYVADGGCLVAMRPDASLGELFGLEPLGRTLAEGYLQAVAGHPVADGIASETLQFHGTADLYHLAGAEAVARLADSAGVLTENPALSVHHLGQGIAAAWTFDLAQSIALMRQGNPTLANQERDGGDGIRAADMFVDWVDLDRLAIPQADEQQRLLANLLGYLSQTKQPLPRLWYFPDGAATMLVATGDSHGNPAWAIEDVLARVERRNGRFSVYYTAFPSDSVRRTAKKALYWANDGIGGLLNNQLPAPSPRWVHDWRRRGHEFGIHPYVEEGLEVGWQRAWAEFTGLGYGPVPPTVRTHRVLWTGWVETARVQATYGMRMNMDYYHWGPLFRTQAGEWVNGYMTGSGLPMKFVDEQGRILDIYQQLTELADDHLLNLHFGGVAKLKVDVALEMAKALIQRSLNGAYSAIVGQFHVDPFAIGGEWLPEETRWLDETLDYAVANGIPIWSGLDWLHFTQLRHDAEFGAIIWQEASGQLSFRLVAPGIAAGGLTVMVPSVHGERELVAIEVDGASQTYAVRTIGAIEYGWVTLTAGTHQVTAVYN